MRILNTLLRSYADGEGAQWSAFLLSLEFAYNDSVVRTTGETPFFLEFGQHPVTPLAMAAGMTPPTRRRHLFCKFALTYSLSRSVSCTQLNFHRYSLDYDCRPSGPRASYGASSSACPLGCRAISSVSLSPF